VIVESEARPRHLGGTRACDLTTDRITAYVAAHQAAMAANATINRELAALKRMFRLAEIDAPAMLAARVIAGLKLTH
jgi:hypothetical protein